MDLNAALWDLKTRNKIEDFKVLGFIPEESPLQVGDGDDDREIEWDIDEDFIDEK